MLSLNRASTCFGPGLHVVRVAALEQREERHAREPAGDLVGTQVRLERGGVFTDQLLAGAYAQVFLELGEFVGAHQRHETYAARGRRGDSHADGVEQRPAQQQAGGAVALDRVRKVGSQLAVVAFLRRHHDAHAGLVLEFARGQHQLELQPCAVA